MSSYRTQQHRLVHRGQSFHFVSYEGQPADEKSHQPEMLPSWYLMLAGKRWMVIPQAGDTAPAELDRQFGEWLEAHVFSGAPAVQSQQPPSAGAATLAGPAEALRVAIPSAGAATLAGPAEALRVAIPPAGAATLAGPAEALRVAIPSAGAPPRGWIGR